MGGCETFLPVKAGRQASGSYCEGEVRELCDCLNEQEKSG